MRVDHIENSYRAVDDDDELFYELNPIVSSGGGGGGTTLEGRVAAMEQTIKSLTLAHESLKANSHPADLRELERAIQGLQLTASQKENRLMMEAKSGQEELKRNMEELAERVSQQDTQTSKMICDLRADLRGLADVASQEKGVMSKSGHDHQEELKRNVEELAERVSQQNTQTTQTASVHHEFIRNSMDVASQQHTETIQMIAALRADIQEFKDSALQKEKGVMLETKSCHDNQEELKKNMEELANCVSQQYTHTIEMVSALHGEIRGLMDVASEEETDFVEEVKSSRVLQEELKKIVAEVAARVSQQHLQTIQTICDFRADIQGSMDVASRNEKSLMEEVKTGQVVQEELKKSLVELAERVSQQHTTAAALHANIQFLQDSVLQKEKSFAAELKSGQIVHEELKNELAERFSEHHTNVVAVQADVQCLKDSSLQKEKNFAAELKSGQFAQDGLKKNVDELSDHVSQQNKRVADLHTDIQRLMDSESQQKEKVAVEAKSGRVVLDGLKKNVEVLSKQVAQQQTTVATLHVDIQSLKQKQSPGELVMKMSPNVSPTDTYRPAKKYAKPMAYPLV